MLVYANYLILRKEYNAYVKYKFQSNGLTYKIYR